MKLVWLPFASYDLSSFGEDNETDASPTLADKVIQQIVRNTSALIGQ